MFRLLKGGWPIVLLGFAILALLAGIWAGWLRIGWQWPTLQPQLALMHGPLMISGFLGTLVSLERAIALRKLWMFFAPLLTGLGGISLILGLPASLPIALITAGSIVLLAVLVLIFRRQAASYTLAMALGGACWLIGNVLWLWGQPIYSLSSWWAAFLILTIAGERLELGRLVRLPGWSTTIFWGIIFILFAGLWLMIPWQEIGAPLFGFSLLGLASWLLIFDVSRHTIRQKGLPRFVAVCLLSGYVWMGAAGIIGLWHGFLAAGPIYDAYLHAIFVGFIFAMIFGHAPLIFPAILGRQVNYHPMLYAPLILLHVSLGLRIVGDFVLIQDLRLWGGLLNGITILIYLSATAFLMSQSSKVK